MRRSVGLWQLLGFGITAVAGTLLHFLYEWTGKAVIVAPFSAINESTWEHMKLLFWPSFIFACFQYPAFKKHTEFWCIKLRGIITGLALIPVIFYTYNGAIGKSPDWLNITIYFLSAAVVYIYETRQFRKKPEKNGTAFNFPEIAFIVLIIIAIIFVVFTFVRPDFGIFKDPGQ